MEWYLKVLKQYSDFSGRARRKEYWMFTLFNMIFAFSAAIFDAAFFNFIFLESAVPFESGVLYGIYVLAVFIPGLAVGVRRLHDVGKSGWMLFVVLIPLIGVIWLLVLALTDSSPGENEYGANPKEIMKTANDKTPVARQDGMRHKYRRLIEYAKSEDPRTKIYKETENQITFGMSGMGGTILFKITETFENVNILWTAENTAFGNTTQEWNYGKYQLLSYTKLSMGTNQDKMMKDIKNDLKIFYDANFGSTNDYLDKHPELKRLVDSLNRDELMIFLKNHPEHMQWYAGQMAKNNKLSEANTKSI